MMSFIHIVVLSFFTLALPINIMQRQSPISQLHLRSLQLIQSSPSGRKGHPLSQRILNSTRTLVRLYLTKQILEQCLQSLDIFRELLDDPVQRTKLFRDVGKNIQLKSYDEGAVVYDRGEVAESLFMVIRGQVSLCMPEEGGQGKEIDVFGQGMGFGEAEFVHGRKRGLMARARTAETVVGVIQTQAFQEIIDLYRQRVYLKKAEMFAKCPLLQHLQTYQIEFIVHNAKPVTFSIGKEINKEGEHSKTIYLITEGTVEVKTNAPSSIFPQALKYRTNSKAKLQDVLREKIKIKSLVLGILQEGQFLGDCQLALKVPFSCTAVVKTSRVRAYACDQRIILSQMTPQLLTEAAKYYQMKQRYREDKPHAYQQAKSQLQRRLQTQQPCKMSPEQQKAKRIIISRYVQQVPSAIGQMSPKEIARIIDRKLTRARSQHTEYSQGLPVISPPKKLVADQKAYSPLLKREREQQRQRRRTELAPPPPYRYQTLQNQDSFQRSGSKTPVVLFRPYKNRLIPLYQRIIKQYKQSRKRFNPQGNYSVIQMRKIYPLT